MDYQFVIVRERSIIGSKPSFLTRLLGFIVEVQAMGKFLVDPYNKEAHFTLDLKIADWTV